MASGQDQGAGDPAGRLAEAHDRVAELYRNKASTLRLRLRSRLGSADEADELLHEAFARLLGARALGELREPGAFLSRIMRNLLVDRARRRAARPVHVPIEWHLGLATDPDQGREIELGQMRERYREIVDSLPPRMREVFILHRINGLSYRDIAAKLDISIRTVEWHVAEAIVRIGRGLDQE